MNIDTLRVFEAFAGYGSQSMALERLRKSHPGFDYQVVGISEIDMNAVAALIGLTYQTFLNESRRQKKTNKTSADARGHH